MPTYRAIPPAEFRWPSGDYQAAALLAAPPQLLEQTCGLVFASGHDDLDYYRAAAVELPSGRRAVLHWNERAPEPRGLELRVDAADDPVAARAEVLAVLSLAEHLLIWAPDLSERSVAGLRGRPRAWEGEVWVILRHDSDPKSPMPCVVMEAVWGEDFAQELAEKHAALEADPRFHYSYQRAPLLRPEPAA